MNGCINEGKLVPNVIQNGNGNEKCFKNEYHPRNLVSNLRSVERSDQ